MYYVTFDKRGSHICCTMNLVPPYYTHYRPIIRYLHVQCIQIVIYVDVYTISYYATVLYVSYEITHKKHITAYGTLQYLLTHHQIKRKKQQKRCRNAIFYHIGEYFYLLQVPLYCMCMCLCILCTSHN